MTEANEMYDSMMSGLDIVVISDTDEAKGEQESFSFHEEEDLDDIPPSLLRYFETSKSRAAVCEKLILEELEVFTVSHHTEDMMNLLTELDEDMMKLKEQRQMEIDFQRELRKIMEAEKLHQGELELMEMRAQEKLEQEFLLQQELISNLQRRVEEERRLREEEQRRMKEEEDKRKREEEKIKIEKKLEDEMRMKSKEEERKSKEEVLRIQEEEERKKIEEAEKKMETVERNMEERTNLKKEEEKRKKRDEENTSMEEEGSVTKEIEEMKKQEEVRKEEEEADNRKKIAQEKTYKKVRKRDKKECGNVDEEIKLEEKKKKEEQERKKMEEKTPTPVEEDEKRKKEDEGKAKEEEQRRRQKEKMSRQMDEEDYRRSEEDMRLKEDKEGYKGYDVDNRNMEHESNTKAKEKKCHEEQRKNVEAEKEQKEEEMEDNKKEVDKKTEEEIRIEKEENEKRVVQDKKESVVRANELQERREQNNMTGQHEKNNNIDKTEKSLASQLEDSTTWTSSSPALSHSDSTICPASTEAITPQQPDQDKNINQTSRKQTMDCENQATSPPTMSVSLPVCLPEHTEQKRLTWMRDCIPWSRLSLQNRRKQKGSVRSQRGPRRAAEASSLPPLCPDSLLQSTGWKSLQEVTTVILEDLPGCSLSTLAQCTQLRSLSLRRCGLKSLEGINQLPHLCYIDVQENDISFVDCENLTSLRVLHLGHNKLTSMHGLTGAENLDALDLSHNSITRIAGLESMRRLQRLSVHHNQLISTKGLRNIYTLLHLNCSHNHLANVEGLENSALLNTLDLRANSLTEAPSLNNQVLLRELHLDDNSISSLQGLTACWLPLMQHLSVAQNRITQLPSMSDFVSLANLDLQFNCMSELQNVCESLDGCQFLREVHLTGNPLQQESGWRSILQKAVPGLRAIDQQQTDSSLSPPAVQQVSLASGSFLTFCQAQLQQTRDLQQRHSRELSIASSPLDAVQTSCRHFTEALQLAKDQRFAHEYGDTTVADKHRTAGQTIPGETLDLDGTNAEKHAEHPEIASTGKVTPVIPNRNNIRCSCWTFDEKLAAESQHANLEVAPESNHQDTGIKNTAAVVIQQLWRKCREKCGNISSPSTAEKGGGRGGDGGKPESRPSYINGSVLGKDYAATVIQAFWRGFTLRRRLASALAAVTCPDIEGDDTFEEVDVDEFVFDEPEPSQCVLPLLHVWTSKQAWVAGEQVDSPGQSKLPVSSNRSKSPASTSVVSGLSERSEKILEEWGFTNSHTALLMLKRAQNMKSGRQQQKKKRDPSTRLALFRNGSYQLGPVEARNRAAQDNRTDRKGTPSSGSIPSARGLASPARPSQRSPTGANVSGFESSPFWSAFHSNPPPGTHALPTSLFHPNFHPQPHQTSVLMSEGHKGPPTDVLEEYWRGIQEVGGGQEGAVVEVREAELGLQRAEKTERVKQERAQQWLHTQPAHSDRDSESVHFLPEISSDILNGGRVQLVADPGYTERLHHASGLWANSSLAAQPCKENNYPRRNSLGHAREEVSSPQRVSSAPTKKERISFRDNPVQLSGGWGGGKKRGKVYK
ncbi:leucine-rich repeat- and IQ domain-containing protein 1 [Symphorus nematophorus]